MVAVGFVWSWVLIGRNQRSWKYAEREDELLVSHGIMFRELVVVPYGRMQFVDVAAGPLERVVRDRDGGAAHRDPGDRRQDPRPAPGRGGRLRDRLSALGQAQAWGL